MVIDNIDYGNSYIDAVKKSCDLYYPKLKPYAEELFAEMIGTGIFGEFKGITDRQFSGPACAVLRSHPEILKRSS
jgi:hypothetical protein